MPFQIVRNDITKVKADVIVNTANPKPAVGSGTDSAIYHAAGEEQLLAERKKIGYIARGNVMVTPAFNLPAKYIIHTVGPSWEDGNHGERDILHSCYAKSLALADMLKAKSIAFPLIATGVYGFPKDEALSIASEEISKFLQDHDMKVILVVFDRTAFQLSRSLTDEIEEYIDEHGIGVIKEMEYGPGGVSALRMRRLNAVERRLKKQHPDISLSEKMDMVQSIVAAEPFVSAIDVKGKTLDDVLKNAGKTFQQKLFELILESGMDDVEIYRAANMERKLFSSIRCKKDYKPKKKTVLALSIGLKLDMNKMQELLASAGYALSPSDKSDLIISYFVENKKYNIVDINIALYDKGLEPLGNVVA